MSAASGGFQDGLKNLDVEVGMLSIAPASVQPVRVTRARLLECERTGAFRDSAGMFLHAKEEDVGELVKAVGLVMESRTAPSQLLVSLCVHACPHDPKVLLADCKGLIRWHLQAILRLLLASRGVVAAAV